MLYKYDKTELVFRPIVTTKGVALALASVATFVGCGLYGVNNVDERIYESIMNVNVTDAAFTEQRLIDKFKRLNMKYPHIAMAQAKLESGNYKSDVFLDNKNLFGMKQARVRINVALGTSRGHAYYSTWEDSVLDYAYWCATYASSCRNEDEFFSLLSRYAEDVNYETKLREVIERDGLRELF
jgi:hypothetical protein